ncbi:MAG TPA: aminotransferase class IV [Candidatus Sulfomarinibacteraceae bacterium]|nr:aminotransferase class IV [Candidatus Sulfomarinibacteraceae bacterium]
MSDTFYSRSGNDRGALMEMLRPAGEEQSARQALRHIDCVWLNGELIPTDEAAAHMAAHILNPALPEGLGVFEGIGCYETERGPALFRPEAHLTRFLQRVRQMGVGDLRFDLFALRRAAHVTVQVNNYSSCYVRPILYFAGEGDSYEPAVAVTASGWESDVAQGVAAREKRQRGIRVMVSNGGKRGRVEAYGAAREAARQAGYDEAILLDEEGMVVDCTAEALFLLRDGVLYTPPQPEPLPGVARDTVITLAGDLGVTVRETPIGRAALHTAEEVFVCGTAAEVTPVRELDDRALGEGAVGPVTARLQALYADVVRGHGPRSRGWLEYVMMEPLF